MPSIVHLQSEWFTTGAHHCVETVSSRRVESMGSRIPASGAVPNGIGNQNGISNFISVFRSQGSIMKAQFAMNESSQTIIGGRDPQARSGGKVSDAIASAQFSLIILPLPRES